MSYQSDILALSPAFYVPLNQISGIAATEMAAAANGTYLPNNGTAWTGGTLSQSAINSAYGAAQFNGTTGTVSVPMAFPPNGASKFTIILSVYPSSEGGYRAMYSRHTTDTERVEIHLGGGGAEAGPRGIVFPIGTGTASVAPDVLTLNAWNVVMVVFDGTLETWEKRAKIYVNGVYKTTENYNIPATSPTIANTTTSIGSRKGSAIFWGGRIGDVAGFNDALTAGQATSLYASAIASAGPGILAITGTVPTSAAVGAAYTGSLTASGGTAPYTYSLFSGTLPAGLSLNSSTGAITGTPTTAGSATLVFRVSDAASATANLASVSLTVSAGNSVPTVTTHPAAQSVSSGSSASFAAAFAGYPTPTVQWQRSTDAGVTWSNVSGATSTTFNTAATTLTGGTANNNDRFRCVATNSQGSATTNAAILSVSSGAGVLQTCSIPANGNVILLNYSGVVSASVGDFTVLVNGINFLPAGFELVSGFQYQLDLGFKFLLPGQTVTVTHAGTTKTATNSSQTDKKRARYVSRRFGMFIHYNMTTYDGGDALQWASPSSSPNLFNPTSDIGAAIDQWVAAAKAANMRYITLTAKHHDGFCLWPSASTTHDIASSSWYAANGSPDIIQLFTSKCRAAGLGVCLYFSVWDRNFELNNPSRTNQDYINHTQTQLTELLSNYGDIDSLWIDGFHWSGAPAGYGFNLQEAQYPYATFRNHIAALQPDTVVVVNNHQKNTATSDIVEVELSAGGTVTPGNRYPAEACESLHKYAQWFYTGGGSYYTKAELQQRLNDLNAQRHTFLMNCPPMQSGLLPAATVKLMADVGDGLNDGWSDYGIQNSGAETITVNVPTALYGPGFGGNFVGVA